MKNLFLIGLLALGLAFTTGNKVQAQDINVLVEIGQETINSKPEVGDKITFTGMAFSVLGQYKFYDFGAGKLLAGGGLRNGSLKKDDSKISYTNLVVEFGASFGVADKVSIQTVLDYDYSISGKVGDDDLKNLNALAIGVRGLYDINDNIGLGLGVAYTVSGSAQSKEDDKASDIDGLGIRFNFAYNF